MKLYIDLEEETQFSKYNIAIGIIFIVYSIIAVVVKLNDNAILFTDWILCGVFILNGVIFLIKGLGWPIERFFGKSYISIDDEQFAIKPNVFKREQRVHWEKVKSIKYTPNKIEFRNIDNETESMDLSQLTFRLKQRIKETIREVAQERKITVNFT